MSHLHGDDLYARLGLTAAATREEVRSAYRILVRQYPPERAPEEFKRIREAYETLSEPVSRRLYDERPTDELQALIARGMLTMDREGWREAETIFKEVLVLSPQLHFVRNFLALCATERAKERANAGANEGASERAYGPRVEAP